MTGSHVVISYDPAPAAAKVARWRWTLTWRVGYLLVMVVLRIVAEFFKTQPYVDLAIEWLTWTLVASVVLIVYGLIRWWLAAREAKRVGVGPAIAIGREGIYSEKATLAWPELGGVTATNGRLGGSPTLTFTGREGAAVAFPMDYLDTLPATIDSAVRTMSGGRARIDFSRLDD
ncbi:MAG: hypothetical protein WAV45_06225 [Propionibacteriaceae bacterium]|nr:hypothetical protein [Micropruina sp.]